MTYTGPIVILAGSGGATLTAKLVEDGANDNDGDGGSAAPNPAETVTLSIGSQSCTATTTATGSVTCTIPSVTVPLGPETVGAAFAGDAFYRPSSDSKTAIVFAFPSRGAFTLGNMTAATAGSGTVTWWADTWSSLNALTRRRRAVVVQGLREHDHAADDEPARRRAAAPGRPRAATARRRRAASRPTWASSSRAR